ncbi:NUDIX domain-containing protein [Nocardia xishanensis]
MRHSRRPSPAYRPAHPGRPRPRRGRPRPGGGRRRRSLAPHNTGYADGQRNLPSGKLEDGEDVVDAVIRETHEEIGIQLDRDEVRLVSSTHYKAPEGHSRIPCSTASSARSNATPSTSFPRTAGVDRRCRCCARASAPTEPSPCCSHVA